MKTITAFELSDGTIVKNEAEAIAKEKTIKFEKDIWRLIDEDYRFVLSEDENNVFEFIKENKAKLLKILKDAE